MLRYVATVETYIALQMGLEMNKLHNENTHVMVHIYKEKESDAPRMKRTKMRSTGVLTPAGSELFEKLRALRYPGNVQELIVDYFVKGIEDA